MWYVDSVGLVKTPRGLTIDGIQHPRNIFTQWTKDELVEYKKCLDDPHYFTKEYCKIIHLDKGLIPFELYPYQEQMFEQFNANRFNIVLFCLLIK